MLNENFLKKFLKRIGIHDLRIGLALNTIKRARLSLLYSELLYRVKGVPDSYPLPPSRMIFMAIENGWVSLYYSSGKVLISKLISHLEKNSITISSFKNILDFGCGCGRLIRHLSGFTQINLFGCDYNPDLIKWCKHNLKFAEFQVNELYPPLNYKGNIFDFVYARSVFNHFGEDLQKQWMDEIYRILKPDGIFYFTTYGEQLLPVLSPILSNEPKKEYESVGFVTLNIESEGKNSCASFQSKKYVENNLFNGFGLVDYIPGRKKAPLHQDTYIIRKL